MFEFNLDNYTVFTELDEDKSLCAFNGEKLIQDIIKVHKELYPNATLQTQIEKYEEEFNELKASKDVTSIVMEFADVFICSCGIRRFSDIVGRDLGTNILRSITNDDDKIILMEAVCRKMNENQKRVWKETKDGYYDHDVSTLN
jgi:hypothetical protein